MRLTIFGATGRVGRLVVEQALAAGHRVAAYARRAARLPLSHGNLFIIQGDLREDAAVRHAVAGADAVLCALGPGVRPRENELSDGVRSIIAAMSREGVTRLVMLSTVSVPDARDRPGGRHALLVRMVRLVFRRAFEEIVKMGEIVRTSPTDWTLVRVPLLTQGPLTGQVVAGPLGTPRLGLFLSRADAAWFMVRETEQPRYLLALPAVSNETRR